MAIHPERQVAVLVRTKRDAVAFVDLASGETATAAKVGRRPGGNHPGDIAIDPGRDLALVTLAKDDAVALLRMDDGRTVATVAVGRGPGAVAVDPELGIAVTANRTGGTASVIELDTRSVIAELAAGRRPVDIALERGAGRAWVTLGQEGAVRVLDLAGGGPIATVPAGARPAGVAVGAARGIAAVADSKGGTVTLIDTASFARIATVPVGRDPRGVAIDEVSGLVLVANHGSDSVSLIDLESAAVVATIPVLRRPGRIAVHPRLALAVVTGHDGSGFMRIPLPDRVPPDIAVHFPPDGHLTNRPDVELIGGLSEPAALAIAGTAATVEADGSFAHTVMLDEGVNDVALVAVDEAGNVGRLTIRIHLDTEPPAAPDVGRIAMGEPVDGSVTISGGEGSVEPNALVTVTNARTGAATSVLADAGGAFEVVVPGAAADSYLIHVTDEAGNEGASSQVAAALPPGPAAVAPALAPDAFTPFADATAFLYSGPAPIQTGVTPGVIDERRAAVLRGRVLDRGGAPVAGVRLTVRGHPQFGETLTRADGGFDLAVNGGGGLVVDYEREGYLPVQRRVDAPWGGFAWLPDVVMIPLDAAVTEIALSSPVAQVARGRPVEDDDGPRQATLVVPSQTRATLEFPDGSRTTLDRLAVRATEYTVGGHGPAAMPGRLPPEVAYTYAVELSADEAIAAGASAVRFDRPLAFYLENFIGFPVGGIVPSGWYDRTRSAWIPSGDGRVVRILAVDVGVAALDTDGSGEPAGPEALAALGITDEELREIASLYGPGQELWRIPVDHFTPWDFNWPPSLPPGAAPPDRPPRGDEKEDRPECERGSIIECENQVLGQTLPIVGTSWTLDYRSDRVPGRSAAYRVDIPLTGDDVHPDLRRIEVEVAVAGQRIRRSFAPVPGQSWAWTWDGRDGYGRIVRGPRPARVAVTYVFPSGYGEPQGTARSFGEFGGAALAGIAARDDYPMTSVWEVMLGVFDARQAGLGGWTLAHHHAWDAATGTLYLGDGRRRDGRTFGALIEPVAGTGERGLSGDGGRALEAELRLPGGIAVAPDGTVYVADGAFFASDSDNNRRVRRITPDGVIDTVAGGGTATGDGGPASAARLGFPTAVAVGPDGSLYIADAEEASHRIRRVAPDGIITTVAGSGVAGYGGDGGPATEARLNLPMGLAVAADGSLYIADWLNSRIRRVGPDGIITTVAGNGEWGFTGDGGPATEARLRDPAGMAIGTDGSLYFADWSSSRIRRVSPDGVITTVAGGGRGSAATEEGIPATEATLLLPSDVAVGRDGSLYIADMINNRVRRVAPDGTITTLAGDGGYGSTGDGGSAAAARVGEPAGVAIGPGGELYVTERIGRVRRIALQPSRPPADDGRIVVGAEDGRAYHVFDAAGRHLRTVDSATGAATLAFEYGDGGLAAVVDADGLRLRVERDPSGRPLGLAAPGGAQTALETDGAGFLTTLVDPSGATWRMEYQTGLLAALTDPNGNDARYGYDPLGRLQSTLDAAGGGWTLTRQPSASGHVTELVSGEGRTRRFETGALPGGEGLRRVIDADGSRTSRSRSPDGVETVDFPDGTRMTLRTGPDPRLLMAAPVPVALRIETPGGVASETTLERQALLANPGDFMSHTELLERIVQNGAVRELRYLAAERRWTETSAAGRSHSVELDGDGRPSRWAPGGMLPVDFDRDTSGRIVGLTQGERSYRLQYDDAGRIAAITDPLSRSLAFDHDAAGRVMRQTLPDGRSIDYSWDGGGNLRGIVPPGRDIHRFSWTATGLPGSWQPPGIDGEEGEEHVTRFSHDVDGSLVRIERPGGDAIDLVYDAAGRPGSVSTARGRYDYRYHPVTGRPAGVLAPDGTGLDWTWDGFLPVSESVSGEVSGTVTRSWNDDFRLESLTVAGDSVTFDYDPDGLLERAGAMTVERDAASGLPIGTRLGAVSTHTEYNGHGEPVAFTAHHAGEVIARFVWERDASGRIVARSEETAERALSEHYAFDAAGRLVSAARDGIESTWGYDANGNRTHADGLPVAGYDARDRLVTYGGASYTHSPNGDLQTRTEGGAVTRYTHDAFGNLRDVTLADGTTIEYVVDGRDRRIGKKIDGELVQAFLYADQINPVAELDGAGAVRSRFVYADRANVPAWMVRDGATYRIVSDHVGSPRLVVDVADGRIAQRIDYDAWGRILSDSNPGFQPFGFAGGIHDHDTGLVRFGARDYDPGTGRWLTKDPLGFGAGDTNLYAYVTSDPVNFLDPGGTFLIHVAGGVLGALAGAGTAAAAGQSIVAGALSGAITGVSLGGGIIANASIGAFAGGVGYLLDARDCGPNFRGGLRATVLGGLGGVIGRELGLRNGLAVARLGPASGNTLGTSTAVVSAYVAQAAGGGLVSGGLSAMAR